MAKPKKRKIRVAQQVKQVITFPAKVLEPVRSFLSREEKRLQKRKKEISEADPFQDNRRLSDNAAPDADAEEQSGHERAKAIRDQVDRKLIQIRKALSRIKIGKYGICEKCGKMIDTDRLMIMPETTVCVDCEKKKGK
ncbi:MAG TPA: TraR/DksA C4-type zinc finger protein [Patescibacteria group bacterium]|nr:TraR/DksA C4-type zinc finger protein [Patescibacteria group bacterium]